MRPEALAFETGIDATRAATSKLSGSPAAERSIVMRRVIGV